MLIVTFLAVVLLVAALAAGFAFAANVLRPAASIARRALIAAVPAGFLPCVPGLIALLMRGELPDVLLPIAALLVGGVVLTVMVAFPIAVFVARRAPAATRIETFE